MRIDSRDNRMSRGWPIAAGMYLCVILASGCPRFQQATRVNHELPGFVRINKERIFVHDQGEGPAVLLIHGYCGSHRNWRYIQPALARHHRVLAVDLPGFGRSDKLQGDYSPPTIARKLLAVLDEKKIEKVHVVGHSWGTSLSLALALAAPDRVRSLSLIGVWAYEDQLPPFVIWSRAPGVGEVLYTLFFDQRLDDRMAMSFFNPSHATPAAVDQGMKTLNSPGAMAAALAAVRGMRYSKMQRRYRGLRQRLLIIHGQQDRVTRLPWALRLNSEVKDSRLVRIEEAGHMLLITQPEKILLALRPFLAGLEPGQAGRAPASSGDGEERAASRPPGPASVPSSAPSTTGEEVRR